MRVEFLRSSYRMSDKQDAARVGRLNGMLEKLTSLEIGYMAEIHELTQKLEAARRMVGVIRERLHKEEDKPAPKKFETKSQKAFGGLQFGGETPTDISKYLTESERALFKKR